MFSKFCWTLSFQAGLNWIFFPSYIVGNVGHVRVKRCVSPCPLFGTVRHPVPRSPRHCCADCTTCFTKEWERERERGERGRGESLGENNNQRNLEAREFFVLLCAARSPSCCGITPCEQKISTAFTIQQIHAINTLQGWVFFHKVPHRRLSATLVTLHGLQDTLCKPKLHNLSTFLLLFRGREKGVYFTATGRLLKLVFC